ncbi:MULTISPECIES: hypothetical protein [Calothrix]|nr:MULTISPECIES: hypothetical protein [Calothrix]
MYYSVGLPYGKPLRVYVPQPNLHLSIVLGAIADFALQLFSGK